MSALKQNFENELKQKLAQKSGGASSEEQILNRAFRYFDLNNNGVVEKNEFQKAMEKIGISITTKEDISTLFTVYDLDGNGSLDYKEFTNILYNRPSTSAGAPQQKQQKMSQITQFGGQERPKKPYQVKQQVYPSELVARLREKLATRGARGIIGLGKSFRIMDDNNSRSLDMYEWTKAMKDYRLGFSDEEIQMLHSYFDTDKSGDVNYDEFLRNLRGPMNQRRKALVQQAFEKLDADKSGVIDINDIRGTYNAKQHPDVISGKKSEEQILMEFLETFETHHNQRNNNAPDGVVTHEEFSEYYANISSSIDNDDYFALMMNNAWKINEGDRTFQPGWSNETGTYGNRKVPKPKSYERDAFIKSSATIGGSVSSPEKIRRMRQNDSQGKPRQQPNFSFQDKQLLEMFRKKLAMRGARGIMGLARQFKIADDDGNRTLDPYEFRKACKDLRITVNEDDQNRLFELFDRDMSGTIDYDEFLRGVRGEMNQTRAALAMKAFQIMDKDGSGILDMDDIKQCYNGKMHPDVKSGKKTEEEVLGEFLDTFEMHYGLTHPGSKDRKIDQDEWLEYYNNVSMSIDDDAYFTLMMNNAWNLEGTRVKKKGWGAEF